MIGKSSTVDGKFSHLVCDDRGSATVEYAFAVVTAVAVALILYGIVNSQFVRDALFDLVRDALERAS